MLKVVLWILAILLLVGIAMLNPLIAAGIVIPGSEKKALIILNYTAKYGKIRY